MFSIYPTMRPFMRIFPLTKNKDYRGIAQRFNYKLKALGADAHFIES